MTGGEFAVIGVIATVASAAASAAATAYSAYQASQAAAYNRQVARNQAAMARQQTELAVEAESEKQRRFRATQRVLYAASGVEEEGSPLMVEADTARQMERDLQLIRYGGQARATGFEAEARLQGFYQRAYLRQGAIGAGVSLLSSAVAYKGSA